MIDRRKEQELIRDIIRCNRALSKDISDEERKMWLQTKEQKLKELADLEGRIEQGEKENKKMGVS